MSKMFALADTANYKTLIAAKPVVEWSICVLCQNDTGETLVNPVKNLRQGGVDGYSKLAEVLKEFHGLGKLSLLPFKVKYNVLDDGAGLADCMKRNNAVWHKSCYRECSKSRLERARKRTILDENQKEPLSPMKTRRMSDPFNKDQCIFCNCPATTKQPLHKIMTEKTSERITQYATELQDRHLLARIAGAEDLIALQGAYHDICYTRFMNRRRSWAASQDASISDSDSDQCKGYALAGVISYILEAKDSSKDVAPVFKLTALKKIYEDGMREFGVQCETHSTRFKERLLSFCPYLEATGGSGQCTLISFRKDIDFFIRKSSKRDYDSEGIELSNAAELVRKDIFQQEDCNWESMSAECQESSIPSSLKALVRMVIRGPQISCTCTEENDDEQAILTIAQLLYFNATKRDRKAITTTRRHDRHKETPVPVYIALKLYGETRKKDLVETTHKLGLSISYDRVKTILTEKSNQVCELFNKEGVVCPPSLRRSVFTTAAADNIDHNTSSGTAKGSFHGTAISFAQHFQPGEEGTRRDPCETQRSRKVAELPTQYSVVKSCYLNVKAVKCPPSDRCTLSPRDETEPMKLERDWLEGLNNNCLSWAAHNAAKNRTLTSESLSVSALLPVLPETAHSLPTMLHCMKVVADGITFLNPGQIPVMTVDQPLYALCKQIQFSCPDTFGEDKFFVMMGGLHIEMAILRVAGQWLEGSGWVDSLIQAEVTTAGRAESMIKATHVTRTRYAHEVTAAVLYSLQKDAYKQLESGSDYPSTFEEWKANRCSHPQFKYWDIALTLELLILQFVRSIRTANFHLYRESLVRMVPWFFSLDHPHYARWMSVHIRDLAALEDRLPQLAEMFTGGYFVAKKTNRSFSAIALDQAHEQMNAQIKGDGGMVGLTENASALQKWMLSGPELASLVTRFEENILDVVTHENFLHHRESSSDQKRFAKHVESLKEAFEDLGNPFLEDTDDLYCISSKKVCSDVATSSVFRIEELGRTQYRSFVQERLEDRCVGIMDCIKRNKCQIMNSPKSGRSNVKGKAKVSGLKNESSLFSRLYIACQTRQGNLEDFFTHENQPFPPALSDDFGEIRFCTKSDLTKCLVNLSENLTCSIHPEFQGKFIDGAVLVNMLVPRPGVKTFRDYVQQIFIPFIRKELSEGLERLDVVWDRYIPDSLKGTTREKRGEGIRMKVSLDTTLPKGWPNFLRVSSNKEALFKILAQALISEEWDTGVEIFTTIDTGVLSRSKRTDLEGMAPCNHEEADTRLLLHVADAVAHGCKRVCVRTVDTDVLVLAVACVHQIPEVEELWVHMGTSNKQQFVSATKVARELGPSRCAALPVFHALTGCDTVSSFNCRGKKTAFDAWMRAYPDATEGFLTLAAGNFSDAKGVVEKFVVAMYDRSGKSVTVDECRRLLFTKKSRQLSNIPPTSDALEQHALRAAYQGGIVWGQTLHAQQILPSPSDWGWQRSPSGDSWVPRWLTKQPASEACLELVKCGCTKGCTEAHGCGCIRHGMPCTQLCECDGCLWEN